MEREIFIDTGGFYALMVGADIAHKQACEVLRNASIKRLRFITTDYILDETATLLMARKHNYLAHDFFEIIQTSKACRVEWTSQERFFRTKAFFLKHGDHNWSFTDCLSFLVMKELRIREALTKDQHFSEAGFVPLLKD